MKELREAIVLSDRPDLKEVKAYMPVNYEAWEIRPGLIMISGHDNAGWTLDGYVLPRLGSGLIAARELV